MTFDQDLATLDAAVERFLADCARQDVWEQRFAGETLTDDELRGVRELFGPLTADDGHVRVNVPGVPASVPSRV